MFNIGIAIAAQGGAAASAALGGVGSAGRRMGKDVGDGAKQAGTALDNVGQKAGRTKAALSSLNNVSFSGLFGRLEGFSSRLDEAGKQAEESFGKARNLGLGLMGAAAGGVYGLGRMMAGGVTKESQLKSIEALSGSRRRANEIYNITDEMSGSSVADLPQLVGASKTLTAAKLFSERNLVAADDLAAVKRDEGVTPADVARAMARLKSGDFGEAFERFRDFGLSRQDFEAQGLKFGKGGDFQGTAEEAIDALVKIIEQRFGGLSKKLAEGTMEGALSNLGDEWGRFTTSLSEQLIPTLTVATRWLQGVTTTLNNMSPGWKKFLAWGAVAVITLLGVSGMGLILMSTLGQAAIAMGVLTGATVLQTGATTAAAGAAGAATITFGSLALAIGAALLPAVLLTAALIALGAILFKYAGLFQGNDSEGTRSTEERREKAGTTTAVAREKKQAELEEMVAEADKKGGLLARMKAREEASQQAYDAGMDDEALAWRQDRNAIARTPQGQALLAKENAKRREQGGESPGAKRAREYGEWMKSEGSRKARQKPSGSNDEIEADAPTLVTRPDGTKTIKFKDLDIDMSKLEKHAQDYANGLRQ